LHESTESAKKIIKKILDGKDVVVQSHPTIVESPLEIVDEMVETEDTTISTVSTPKIARSRGRPKKSKNPSLPEEPKKKQKTKRPVSQVYYNTSFYCNYFIRFLLKEFLKKTRQRFFNVQRKF